MKQMKTRKLIIKIFIEDIGRWATGSISIVRLKTFLYKSRKLLTMIIDSSATNFDSNAKEKKQSFARF